MVSGIAGDTGLIVPVDGLKSKSCVGKLKRPPNEMATPVVVAVAALLMWIWLGESTLLTVEPDWIPDPLTAQPTSRIAVEGIFVMMVDPLVIFPDDVNPDGPASAARIT